MSATSSTTSARPTQDIYDTLEAGPIERLDRGYSLDEIRYNTYLRDRMRRIDLDTVNFEFGAWQVPPDQYNRLERIANAINRVLDRRPDEIFLIEGHTDAVGSDIDNLTLSDRRAEEVAIILTETFRVPPENLVTQGYGEEFLKIPTLRAERAQSPRRRAAHHAAAGTQIDELQPPAARRAAACRRGQSCIARRLNGGGEIIRIFEAISQVASTLRRIRHASLVARPILERALALAPP